MLVAGLRMAELHILLVTRQGFGTAFSGDVGCREASSHELSVLRHQQLALTLKCLSDGLSVTALGCIFTL